MKNGYIDIVCNLYTHRTVQEGRTGIDDEFKRQVRMPEDLRNGLSIEDYLEKMDRSNIERSLLIAVRAGDMNVRGSHEIPYDYVWEICRQYPKRFSGLAGVDPTRGMQGLRDLEICGTRAWVCRRTLVPALVRDGAERSADLSLLCQML